MGTLIAGIDTNGAVILTPVGVTILGTSGVPIFKFKGCLFVPFKGIRIPNSTSFGT